MRSNLLPILVAVTLAGCSDPGRTDFVTSAKTHIAKGSPTSAVIELKTALQTKPDAPEIRYLLGTALLAAGQPVLAEVELRKALDGGHARDAVVPALARTMLALGEQAKVESEFGATRLDDPAAAADLATTLAEVTAQSGKLEEARSRVAEILQARPDCGPAILLKARLTAASGDVDGAVNAVRAMVAKEPASADGWLLLAELLLGGKHDSAGALDQFKKVLEIRPTSVPAHSSIVLIQLQRADVAAAEQQWASMRKALPGHPQTRFLEAQVALAKGDSKGARDLAQQLLQVAPDHVRLLQFSGAIEIQAGAYRQAELLLNKALQLQPSDGRSRDMLANVYINSGQPENALRVLQPLLDQPAPESKTLAMAGQISLLLGDLQRAEAYYGRAAKASPDDTKARTALALLEIAKGNAQDGLRELHAISGSSRTDVSAEMAIITTLLRRKEFDAAMQALKGMEAKQPSLAQVDLIRGRIYLVKGDRTAARKSFEAGVAKNPRSFPCVSSLALLDVSGGDLQGARGRYDNFLKAEPTAAGASLAYRAMAGLSMSAKAPKAEISGLLRESVKRDPKNVPAWSMLIEHYLKLRETKAAVAAGTEGLNANPDSPELLSALGRAHLAANDANQAVNYFSKLVRVQPTSAAAHFRLGRGQLAINNEKAAMLSLRRALEIDPEMAEARRSLISLAIKRNRIADALDTARAMQKRLPDDGYGYLLEGEIQLARRANDDAIAAFRRGLDRPRPGWLPVRLHEAYIASGKTGEAERFATSWMKSRPADLTFVQHLADLALEKNDNVRAEHLYQLVLDKAPDNVRSLNNLAWAKMAQGKLGAVALAERAALRSGDRAEILDTLAHALAAEKQYSRAVEVAKRVLRAGSDEPLLLVSMASVLVKAGDRSAALDALDKVAKSAANAELKAKAADLKSELAR